jgi:hypothetical protein
MQVQVELPVTAQTAIINPHHLSIEELDGLDCMGVEWFYDQNDPNCKRCWDRKQCFSLIERKEAMTKTNTKATKKSTSPSDVFLPIARAIVNVSKIKKLTVGQAKTTVFLKHEDIRKKILAFTGSMKSMVIRSPFLMPSDKKVQVSSLGVRYTVLKDPTPEQIETVTGKILKRAKVA